MRTGQLQRFDNGTVHARGYVAFPGAEARVFANVGEVPSAVPGEGFESEPKKEKSPLAGSSQLPGLDSNQQPSG
jgi:hypothetical protein